MVKKIDVDKNKCIKCGLCIKDCITSCIEFGIDQIPQYRKDGENSCIECQHCMAICPAGALSFGDKKPENSTKTSYANSNELLNLIKSRRSIRQYKKTDIPAEAVGKIIDMLPYVPTGVNIDDLHFSIVETKAKMDKIRDYTYKTILEETNPEKLGMMAMFTDAIKGGNDIIFRGATGMIVVAVDKSKAAQSCVNVDPVIALSYVDLYAQSLGLGTLWCGIATEVFKNFPEILAKLEIPENYTIAYVMILGVPAVKYARTIQPDDISIKGLR